MTTRVMLLAALVCAGVVMSGARLDEPLRAAAASRRVTIPGTLPLVFERVKPGVYSAHSRGYDVKVTRQEVVIALAGGEALPSARVRLAFDGAAPGLVAPEAPVDGTPRAVKARRPAWLAATRTFARVRLSAIHPGVDVVFYGSDRQLEYEIHAATGSQPERVALSFDGAESIAVDTSGDLVVWTAGRQLVLRRPAAFQDVNGIRTAVAAEYAVRNQLARVVLGHYDPAHPLVIHPAP